MQPDIETIIISNVHPSANKEDFQPMYVCVYVRPTILCHTFKIRFDLNLIFDRNILICSRSDQTKM